VDEEDEKEDEDEDGELVKETFEGPIGEEAVEEKAEKAEKRGEGEGIPFSALIFFLIGGQVFKSSSGASFWRIRRENAGKSRAVKFQSKSSAISREIGTSPMDSLPNCFFSCDNRVEGDCAEIDFDLYEDLGKGS